MRRKAALCSKTDQFLKKPTKFRFALDSGFAPCYNELKDQTGGIAMFVIVGLGNPGRKYMHTRHNVGFDAIDVLAQKHDIAINRLRCKAVVGEGRIAGERVVLAQPQTYMNLSGESVVQLCNWYKPEDDHLIVVFDDVDLPEGKLRFRPSGSAGTHNGMRNIIYLLGRDNFPRLRVGIGRPPEGWDMKDWVLAGYDTAELRKTMFDAYMNAADVIAELIAKGVDPARQLVGRLNNG